jgi:hypothetical protein
MFFLLLLFVVDNTNARVILLQTLLGADKRVKKQEAIARKLRGRGSRLRII